MKKTPRAPALKVQVTEELIAEGRERDSGYCMLSEAVKAAFPDAAFVSSDIQTIRFSDPTRRLRYTYLTPRVAQIALIHFDQKSGPNGGLPEAFDMRLSNGQVTRMTISSAKRKAANALLPKEEQERLRKNSAAARKVWRAHLSQSDKGMVADKIGGRPPPAAPLSRRRAFGLRALIK